MILVVVPLIATVLLNADFAVDSSMSKRSPSNPTASGHLCLQAEWIGPADYGAPLPKSSDRVTVYRIQGTEHLTRRFGAIREKNGVASI